MANNLESIYQTQLGLIQTAITAALANPQPNYRVGEVSYNHADYIEMLFDQQSKLISVINELPAESLDTVQDAVDQFGVDHTDYHGEAD